MFRKDLIWLVRSYFARFKLKASDPRFHFLVAEGDVRLRTRRALFVQLPLFLLPYGLASAENLSGGVRFGPARAVTLVMWPVGLAAYLTASLLLPRVKSAFVAQAALALTPIPLGVSLISAGAQVMMYLLGPEAIIVMLTTIATISVLLWRTIRSRRILFYDLLRKRKYRQLLRNEEDSWSPRFEVEQSSLGRIGCIGIGLSVSGPAIGMHLHRMIGRPSANIVMGIAVFFLGAVLLYGFGYQVGLYLVEMRRIESRIGRSLTLPPYREEDEPLNRSRT